MTKSQQAPQRETKGERTARRIMDVAQGLFARQGYDGTSLRQIAEGAGIREPGLYNHFSGKQGLYEAVLHRALDPMATVLGELLQEATDLRHYTELPSVMTDMLLQHPQMAPLLQQALQGDRESVANRLLQKWLDTLFRQGLSSLETFDPAADLDRDALAINIVAIFNLTTGYFLSQPAFDVMAEGDLHSPDNIARQKQLLRRVIRAMLVS